MTFWEVKGGSLGMRTYDQSIFKKPIFGGDVFSLLDKVFDIDLDRFLCHIDRFVKRPAIGDTSGKNG